MGGWHRSERALGIAVIMAAAFRRPLVFWAANAWDLSDLSRPLLFGVFLSALGLLVFWAGSKVLSPIPLGAGIGLGLIIAVLWERLAINPLLTVFIALLAVTVIAFLNPAIQSGVAVALIIFLGFSAGAQVILAHVSRAAQLPTVDLQPSQPTTPTGNVEDILLLVVDSYPALTITESWFGHDPSALRTGLEELGYTVPDVAWSQHTFTTFSISAMLELQPVVDAGSKEEWHNSRSLYEIMQGESLVVESLSSAGFRYTHVESGLDHFSCDNPDSCVGSSWLEEVSWHLLKPTILGDWLTTSVRSWMVPSTLAAHDGLLEVSEVFDDGRRDFVIAHFMLPHEPFVVDADCRVVEPGRSRPPSAEIKSQFKCVDRLLVEVAALSGDRTAVLITADHGTKSRGQISIDPDDWTDADIAEAFGIFMAYRFPDECEHPSQHLNTLVMQALVECAIVIDPPSNSGDLLIGLHDYRLVSQTERRAIEAALQDGLLSSTEDEVLSSSDSPP